MIVKGIQMRFDCADGAQYETIGAFWDVMRAQCPDMKLCGVGFGWGNDTLCYLIGTENGIPHEVRASVSARFPDAEPAEITLPDTGWKTYAATADTLDKLYAEIYQDGPLTYEIERFDEKGNAAIQVYRAGE